MEYCIYKYFIKEEEMKAIKLLITLGVLLTAFLVGGIALANDPSVFDSVTSDSTLAAPKLTVTITGTNVSLSWSEVTGAEGYQVHYAQYPYDNPDTIKTINVGAKTSDSFVLLPGDAYYVAVKACDVSGLDCSDYSNIHKVIITPFCTFKNSLGQEFKLLPAGAFKMGSPSDEPGRGNDEIQHQVTLTQTFYMQTTEVTQEQWEAVMGSNPSSFKGCPTCPVEWVSWNDVQGYVTEMNKLGEGTSYSLPTEAQWEYSARAGSTTAFSNGRITELECECDPNLDLIGWYCYNSGEKPHQVAGKAPNAWGLYDMSGNVSELCQDWYGSYPSGAVIDPTGPLSGLKRVHRGGSWYNLAVIARSADRRDFHPDALASFLGFRLVMVRMEITGPDKGNATIADVLDGKTFSSDMGKGLTGIMPNRGGKNYSPTTTDQPIAAGYYDGSGKVEGDEHLLSGNIRSGVSIFDVPGDTNVVNTSSGDAAERDILSGKKAWVAGSEVTGNVSAGSNVSGADGSKTFTIPDGLYSGSKTATANDTYLVASNIKDDVIIFGITGTYPLAGVARTGQTPTVPENPAQTGSDGDLQKGVSWPNPRFTNNGDGTVTDNLTGLIWLKDANCFGRRAWATALSDCNSLANGTCGLNDGSSDGDWRLPNAKELYSLIDLGRYGSALPSGHPFTDVQSDYYWSSTTYADSTSYAWFVNLNDGYVYNYSKVLSLYVWPVRGGE